MIVDQHAINPEYIKMRWQEPYVSGGLNRKMFGVIPPGVYHGLTVTAGPGSREVTISTDDPFGEAGTTSGYGGGNYDCAAGYSIAVSNDRRGYQQSIAIEQGVSGTQVLDCTGVNDTALYVVMTSRFTLGYWTDGHFALATSDEIDAKPEYVVIATVNVPGSGTDIDDTHITYRDGSYPRTEPFATWYKWGFMKPEYVRKIDTMEDLMFHKLTGGGTVAFNGAGTQVSWDSAIRIYIPGRTDDYYIDAGNATFPDNGYCAYVRIPNTTPVGSLTIAVEKFEDIVPENSNGMAVPVFIKALNLLYAGAGNLNLEPDEEAPDGIDSNLPGDVRSLLGVSETATVWGFTNNFPGLSTQNAHQRWSSLSLDDENLHEDRNILLNCSGNVEWEESTGTLTWHDPFVLTVPNESFDWTINCSSVSGLADGDILYTTVTRTVGGPLTMLTTTNGSLPLDKDNKNHFVVAYVIAGKLVFRNGYVVEDGNNAQFESLIQRDDYLRWDAVMNRIVITGEIKHYDNTSGQIEWDETLYIRSLSGRLYYEVTSGTISLEDEWVGYLDLDRGTDIDPKLLWVNGSDTLASVGAASWTSGLDEGDWVKKKELGINKYYRIQSVDSVSQVTLEHTVDEDSSPAVGEKSQYSMGNPSVQIAHRKDVPEDAYWLFFRDDQAATKARIQVRDLGELAQGEKIVATNWIYEETTLSETVSGYDTEVTLPNDSRNANQAKYYRVGTGDLEIEVNGVGWSRDQVTVVPDFALFSYASGTGVCTVLGAVDLSRVRRGDFYLDSLSQEWRILGNVTANSFRVAAGEPVDTGFGGEIYRLDYEEIGTTNCLSDKIRIKRDVPINARMKFRIAPINRPYSDGSGSGVSGCDGSGGAGGSGTLQDAYDNGYLITVIEGRPVTFVGTGLSGKTVRIIGDVEITGGIDPTFVDFTATAASESVSGNTVWLDLSGNLWFEDRIRSVSHMLTEQGKWKKTYQNNTGASMYKGRVVVKDGLGKIKHANRLTELNSNVIGILLQSLAHTATGYVQREGWVEGSIFDTTDFVEALLPTEGEAVWLAAGAGKMTVSGPAVGSGHRSIRVGIWEDGGLLWQVRDYGFA